MECENLEVLFVSIAGISHFIFRQIFMKENTIGCLPNLGYNPNDPNLTFKIKIVKIILKNKYS
jgi:hypothetical protein